MVPSATRLRIWLGRRWGEQRRRAARSTACVHQTARLRDDPVLRRPRPATDLPESILGRGWSMGWTGITGPSPNLQSRCAGHDRHGVGLGTRSLFVRTPEVKNVVNHELPNKANLMGSSWSEKLGHNLFGYRSLLPPKRRFLFDRSSNLKKIV
jgi:hypothetical protein